MTTRCDNCDAEIDSDDGIEVAEQGGVYCETCVSDLNWTAKE